MSQIDVSISVPESVRQFVDAQVCTGRYRDVGEYLAALIEADQRRAAQNSSAQDEFVVSWR